MTFWQNNSDIPNEGESEMRLSDYVRSKRRVAFWRGTAIGALIIGLFWLASSESELSYPDEENHIARIRVEGAIFHDPERQEMIEEIAGRDDVKAVIVEIDSPGGAVYPSYKIYETLAEIGEEIPVVAVMEDYAASGGLMVALSAEHIFASPVTVTGSIGVVGEMLDFEDAMKQLGINSTVFRTSDTKGGPSPFRTPTQAEIASIMQLLESTNDVFKDMVAERRGLNSVELAKVATGDAFVGQKALYNKLFDEMGDSYDAEDYLKGNAELADLEVVDWEPLYEPVEKSILDRFASTMVEHIWHKVEALSYQPLRR